MPAQPRAIAFGLDVASADCLLAAETSGLPENRLGAARRAKVPLLVLLRPGQGFLAEAGFEAGARSRLILPINQPQVYEVFSVTHLNTVLDIPPQEAA